MDISKLKRVPEKVKATLYETSEHQLLTKTGCKVIFPVTYTNKGLAHVGSEVSVLGIFAIVIDGDYYAVSKSTSMMVLTPSSIETIKINDVDHYQLIFEAGGVVIKNTHLVKENTLVNNIMDYFIDYGHSPWFINYVDHAEIFIKSGYFNGIHLGDVAVMDMITAHVSRDPKKFEQNYRHGLKSPLELFQRPTFLPTRDIANNTTSNLARINGSELQRGIKATLLAKPERAEPLEQHFLK